MKTMVGLVSANYNRNTFDGLTEDRPVASLPFGGRYRLVDFPLSNMVNSGIVTVGLLTPYLYRSLMDHVGVGKEWALSRKVGGMFILPGSIYGLKSMNSKFLLRDLIQNRPFLERADSDVIVVSGVDKLVNIDYREVAKAHEASGADITLIYKEGLVPDDPAELYLEMTDNGRVTAIRDTPDAHQRCFIGSFLINSDLLLSFTKWYEALGYMDAMDIFAENLDKMVVYGYRYRGFVGVVNDLASYMETNRRLLDDTVRNELFRRDRPITTKVQDSPPTKYLGASSVRHSLIASGCIIEGSVEDSIIFRGVNIKKGAVVKNCVIMQNSVIGENARLENVVCDKYVNVKNGVQTSGSPEKPIAVGKRREI